MTARIAGFLSRSDCGLRAAKSRSTRVTPGKGGTAVHWGGPGSAPATLAGAIKLWRAWQTMHMAKPRGWADIAYTVGVTQTGHVLAGRGYGVRTAAQGTNDGNDRYLAVVWIGGEDSEPTQAALDAVEWVVADFQEKGAGRSVRSHRTFHQTTCSGARLTRLAESLDGKHVTKSGTDDPTDPAPEAGHRPGSRTLRLEKPQMSGDDVAAVQRWAGVKDDGWFGPNTRDGVRAVQDKVGVTITGVVDGELWKHYAAWVAWTAAKEQEAKETAAAKAAAQAAAAAAARNHGVTADVPAGYGWEKGTKPMSRAVNGGRAHGGVRKLQAQLKARGLYDGAVDGLFGPATEAAVVAFQNAIGMTPPGVVGPLLWESAWTRKV